MLCDALSNVTLLNSLLCSGLSSTGLRVGGSELVSEFEGRGNASDGSSLGGDLSPEKIINKVIFETEDYKIYHKTYYKCEVHQYTNSIKETKHHTQPSVEQWGSPGALGPHCVPVPNQRLWPGALGPSAQLLSGES